MTSSVLDGAGCESPAPPAFSPLTDPAPDPGNREPSVNAALDQEHADTQDANNGKRVDNPDGALADAPAHSQPNGNASAALPPDSPTQPKPVPDTVGDAMDLDGTLTPNMDYTAGRGLDLYSQHPTQLLMALARLSAASQPQHMVLPQGPTTVRPSHLSLPSHAGLDHHDALQPANDATQGAAPVDAPLESFARIEFADSVFQMTTYAVVIGRDQRALEQARRDERRLEEYQRRVRENEQLGLPAPSPPAQDRGKFSKSYVSEEGGMLGPESDGDENPRPTKRRKTSGGAGSASGDSHQQEAAAGDQAAQEEKNPTFNRQYVSHTPGAAAVNLSALRPSPYYVPFIGIHSPGPNIASRTKAISREHLRIEFNQQKGVFEAIPLHKNGFFCEDVHYKDEKVVLRSGDRLQIKDVDFVFIINGVPRGKTGAEDLDEDGVSSRRYSEGGKEMSFDFEGAHDVERRSTTPEELPAEAANEDSSSELSEPAEDIPEPEEIAGQEVMETIEKDAEEQPPIKPEIPPDLLADLPPIPKKRGPGRPPKNGIMSKREERLRKKAAMELAKKNMPQPPPGDPPVKRKVGRPRKHPLPENAPDRPEKRKYKPRKSKNGEEGGEGSDAEKTVKERRREKPKTPPLELNREDYTEEQLQKPNKNYGVLIDEVLSAAPDGLTLKQIYKRIQMKYPYYYFAVDTKGWESSVRHNLIGNDAFKKNEETHLWSRVPGIDIDAGKKRKATSPDHSSSMHTFGQPYAGPTTPSAQNRPGSVSQRTGYPPGHDQMTLGQHPQQPLGTQAVGVAGQQAQRQAFTTPTQVPGTAQTAGYGDAATARPLQMNAQATAYSSPYVPKLPPTATAQSSTALQGGARQGLPPHSGPSPYNGLPRLDTPSAHVGTSGSAAARPAQPTAVNGTALALPPAVAPELVKYVTSFKETVTEQLSKRTSSAEAVATSVINRGLGLAAESTVPDQEGLEKIVLGVFESSRKKLGPNQSLHPGLVQALVNFKTSMIKTLEQRMGKLNSERLILSAVDRVLGFADRSTMPGTESERKQYDEAETVLIRAIELVVTEHRKTLAAVAAAAAPTPTPRPGPGPSAAPAANTASSHVSGPGNAPASAVSSAPAAPMGHPATTHLNSTTKPGQPVSMPAPPTPATTRPPVSTPLPAPATEPTNTGTTDPQGSLPAASSAQNSSHIPATPASQGLAQAPVSATAQAPGQASGQTAAPAAVHAAKPASDSTTSQPAAQASAGSPTRVSAQAAAPAPGQAQAPTAAEAQAQAPPPAPVSAQGPAQDMAQDTAQSTVRAPAPATTAAPTGPEATVSQSGLLVATPATTASQSPALSAPVTSQAEKPPLATPQSPLEDANLSTTRSLGQAAPVPDMSPDTGQDSAQTQIASQVQTGTAGAPTSQTPVQAEAAPAVCPVSETPAPKSAGPDVSASTTATATTEAGGPLPPTAAPATATAAQ
ncbi:hypothetical protein VTK56DRAFT_1371 [Thermocarpiscus australiensis]